MNGVDVVCTRCGHAVRAHGLTGMAQRGQCKATIPVYLPATDRISYSWPCDCPAPDYNRQKDNP